MSLLEGLIASVILLTGMVGVLQGLLTASTQNSWANRHMRASIIARELLSAIEGQSRSRLFGSGGLFDSTNCVASPTPTSAQAGELPLSSAPSNFSSFSSVCWVNFDGLGASLKALTPGYNATDDTTFSRWLVLYQNPSNTEVAYAGVAVSWRQLGVDRSVTRMTAIYDTTINQTSLEY